MMSIDGARIRPLCRFPMRGEFRFPDLVRELTLFRLEIDGDPLDVMLSRIGVRHFLADRDFYLKKFSPVHFFRDFNDRNVFFILSVS